MADLQENPQNIDPQTRERVLKEVAGELGWAGNTLTDGMTAYKVPRGNESATGLVIAEHQGEAYVLVERPKRNNDRWELPAGYREYLPETPLQQNATEAGQNMQEPTRDVLRATFLAKRDEMVKAGQSAKQIQQFFEDEDLVEAFLTSKGIKWDARKMDATNEGTLIREVAEETGLQINSAKVEHVDTFGTVNIGSGGGRNNHTDHFFLADLGQVETLPSFTLQQEEVEEAKWVKLADIQKQADGSYTVEGGLQLEQGQSLRMELALQQRLNNQVAAISGMRMELSGIPTLAGKEGVGYTQQVQEKAEKIAELVSMSPEALNPASSIPNTPRQSSQNPNR